MLLDGTTIACYDTLIAYGKEFMKCLCGKRRLSSYLHGPGLSSPYALKTRKECRVPRLSIDPFSCLMLNGID